MGSNGGPGMDGEDGTSGGAPGTIGWFGGRGGAAYGGAIAVVGSLLQILDAEFTLNVARGGQGGRAEMAATVTEG